VARNACTTGAPPYLASLQKGELSSRCVRARWTSKGANALVGTTHRRGGPLRVVARDNNGAITLPRKQRGYRTGFLTFNQHLATGTLAYAASPTAWNHIIGVRTIHRQLFETHQSLRARRCIHASIHSSSAWQTHRWRGGRTRTRRQRRNGGRNIDITCAEQRRARKECAAWARAPAPPHHGMSTFTWLSHRTRTKAGGAAYTHRAPARINGDTSTTIAPRHTPTTLRLPGGVCGPLRAALWALHAALATLRAQSTHRAHART